MIQDELNQQSLKAGKNGILLILKTSNFTLKLLVKAISKFINNKRFTGEQSIKNLVSSGKKLESIDLQTELKPFTDAAKKAGINYSVLKDKTTNPPTYNIFFEGKDKAVIEKFMEKVIKDWQLEKMKPLEKTKTSIHEKLNKFRENIKKQAVNKDKMKQQKNNKQERIER